MSAEAVMEATAETLAAEKMPTATDARTLAFAFMKKVSSKCCLLTWILFQISIFIYVKVYANLAMGTQEHQGCQQKQLWKQQPRH